MCIRDRLELDAALAQVRAAHGQLEIWIEPGRYLVAAAVEPMITYGTNPGMVIPITGRIPERANDAAFDHALAYMGFEAGAKLQDKSVNVVFLGSCTNGRLSDPVSYTHLDVYKRQPRHMEQPDSRHSAPASMKTACSPSASAALFTACEPGTTSICTPGAILRPRSTDAAARRSESLSLIHIYPARP